MLYFDVIIIGAGAAGMMAAKQASRTGKKVAVIEHSEKIGAKIKISGGGRCNFTNKNVTSTNFLSNNPNFIKSSLSAYDQNDFLQLIETHKISYHEKTLGQLFCDNKSQQIIDMFISECMDVKFLLNCKISNLAKPDKFILETNLGTFSCHSLIVACGGLSIPKLGATNFGYQIAKQFGINIIPPKPALVPLIYETSKGLKLESLAGISISAIVRNKKTSFKENILFTHRGLSGPAILQISSYLDIPDEIYIDLAPGINDLFLEDKSSKISNILKRHLPNRFIDNWFLANYQDRKIAETKKIHLQQIESELHSLKYKITGTEGYNKAEVTSGGVDTNELSSRTMETKKIPNLYFIGEVVDITGWLGGYNFQWAWSSGFCAGNNASLISST